MTAHVSGTPVQLVPDMTQPPRLGWSPAEFGELINKSRETVYDFINSGELKAVKRGKHLFISVKAGAEFLGMTPADIPFAPPGPRQATG